MVIGSRGRALVGLEQQRPAHCSTEREGPHVSAPKRRGFGTIVIETMAEYSLDGAVDLHYEPSGVSWRLTCPIMSALESG